ncbi:MAG: peptidyl-prolyl cis-trans isomerase [Proteobacteria bacterium]|nr:peptidyl-prolyl cis-trans isomerase [Pseudomonadota bacterium]
MSIQERRTRFFTYRHLAVICVLSGCAGKPDEADPKPRAIVTNETEKSLSTHVVATVDGAPILDIQVTELVEATENRLTPQEALEILIRTELLAKEAKRRGFGDSPEVVQARDIELVHALFRKQITDKFNVKSLDAAQLRKYYQKHQTRFVHDLQRRVVHFLAHTGNNQLEDKQALAVATQVFEATRRAKNEEEFKSLAKTVSDKDEYRGKTRIEDLPPFEVDSTDFASPFVKATFAIPNVGQVSPPVKTSFGWHVIYYSEEIPAKNVSFEDAKMQLAKELLPQKQTFEASALFKSIFEKSNIFIYEDALHNETTEP